MPNWCSNEVIISSDNAEQLKAFAERLTANHNPDNDGDGLPLCETFLPTPKALLDADMSKPTDQTEFANALSGNKDMEYSDWYTWRLAHWGTKWDVSYLDVDTYDDGRLLLSYETAWSPINDFWDKVSEEYPDLVFDERFFEEGMGFIGEIIHEAGERTAEESGEIEVSDYVKAGAIASEDGKIDWDADQAYNLFDIFPII